MKRAGIVVSLFSMLFSALSAQDDFKISKPDPSYSNNTLTIRYDITGCGSRELIDIKLILINSKGDTIKPVTITGDINQVNCGDGKTIKWYLARDSVKIDEDIQILITGSRSVPDGPSYLVYEEKRLKKGNVLLSSALIPGLGQKKITGKPAFFAFTGLVYGTLGASGYYNFIRSKKLKDDYLAATGEERDIMFEKWEKNYNTTRLLAFGAAGAWAVNFIWSAIMPVREDPATGMDLSLTTFRKNELLVSAKWTF